MLKPLELDDFHAALTDASPGHPPGWDQGFAEGHAMGLAEAEAASDVLQAQTVQALADIGFAVNEATTLLMARLVPFLAALAGRILPELRRELAGEHIRATLLQFAAAELDQSLTVSVHPSAEAGLARCMPQGAPLRLTIRPDAGLLPGQILIGDPGTENERLYDSEALWTELARILAAFDTNAKETKSHG